MTKAQISYIKQSFPKGCRVQVDNMNDPMPVPPGMCGTVLYVDDMGTVHCKFDNRRQLGLCPEVDMFHRI